MVSLICPNWRHDETIPLFVNFTFRENRKGVWPDLVMSPIAIHLLPKNSLVHSDLNQSTSAKIGLGYLVLVLDNAHLIGTVYRESPGPVDE